MNKRAGRILIIAVGLAGLLGVGARYAPLTTEAQPVVSSTIDPVVFEVPRGVALVQTVELPPGLYSGVVLYTAAEKLDGRGLTVTITNARGERVAQSHGVLTEYFGSNDHLRLKILTNWFRVAPPQLYEVSVELIDGEPLPLILVGASEVDAYKEGQLTRGGEVDAEQRDLTLSVLKRVPWDYRVQAGVDGAIITLLIVALAIAFLPAKRRWLIYGLLLLAITPVVLAGYWFSAEELGQADWDYYFSLHHYYRDIIVTHDEFPFWNPYTCGGTAGLGDPEFPVFMPTYWLELIFDIPVGVRLAIWLATATGALGMLMLGKRLKLSPEGALLAALAVAFSSVNLLEITEGHVNVFAAMWIPWIFWAWLTAYRRGITNDELRIKKRNLWYLICGIFLALIFYQGGIYLLMYTLLAFITLPFLVKRPLVAIKTTAVAGGWALGLAAAKLLPVLAWLRAFPDEVYTQSAFTLNRLLTILAGRHIHGEYILYQQASGWHEYGAYLGYFILGLAVLALSRWRQRAVKGLTIAAVLAAVLSSLGPELKGVFDLLWWFPRSNISRVILFAVIPLALLAGLGLDRLRRVFHRRAALVAMLLIGLVAVDQMSLASQIANQAFVLPDVESPIAQPPSPVAFTVRTYIPDGMGEHFTRAYAAARAGWGTFHYCSVLGPTPRAIAVEDEFGGPYVAVAPRSEQASVLSWSPNRTVIRVVANEPVRVALNTNMAPGWEAINAPLIEQNGRVGTELPAGEHTIEFRYRTPGWRAGSLITLLTIAGAATWLGYTHKRNRRP